MSKLKSLARFMAMLKMKSRLMCTARHCLKDADPFLFFFFFFAFMSCLMPHADRPKMGYFSPFFFCVRWVPLERVHLFFAFFPFRESSSCDWKKRKRKRNDTLER